MMNTIAQAPSPATDVTRLPAGSTFGPGKVTTGSWIVLGCILVVAWLVRAQDFHFSTAYMDESIYVIYGRMFLAHRFESPLDTPLQWSFGWYLWPMMAAWADRIGGLTALREMSAGLGVLSVAAIYGFARRVFSNAIGLGSALIVALIAPAILASRIATRDAGAICFFALGVWMFARAWRDNRKRDWAAAGICLFAAFLCKYLVAIYFPPLVLLALWKRRAAPLLFIVPLTTFCALYASVYWNDLMRLLQYGAAYGSLRAPAPEAMAIYFWNRWDFWLIVVAALPAIFIRKYRVATLLMWAGAAIMLLFQFKSRADYDYWKHVNYALIFLVPAAAAGVMHLSAWFWKSDFARTVGAACAGALLASVVAFLGRNQSIDEFMFWPNVDPILAYFEGKLTQNDRVLVDDTVFRYYFSPPLHQYQITDPMYFRYGEASGGQAYKTAIHDGAFSFVVLDGGTGGEARTMDEAIRPLPDTYKLEFVSLDPTRGQRIEIYAKLATENPQPSGPIIRLTSPVNNAVVMVDKGLVAVEGSVSGAQAGWYGLADVFTNRWYPQGGKIPISGDGSFHHQVTFGGEGQQQCNHLLRVQLFDQTGAVRATILNYGITRANQDGSMPACRLN